MEFYFWNLRNREISALGYVSYILRNSVKHQWWINSPFVVITLIQFCMPNKSIQIYCGFFCELFGISYFIWTWPCKHYNKSFVRGWFSFGMEFLYMRIDSNRRPLPSVIMEWFWTMLPSTQGQLASKVMLRLCWLLTKAKSRFVHHARPLDERFAI